MQASRKTAGHTGASSTIHDVARHAGVSYMTVSRVINGSASVAPATRRRVEASIKTLHFEPSAVAQSLGRRGLVKMAVLHRSHRVGQLGELLVSLLDQVTDIYVGLSLVHVPFVPDVGDTILQLSRRGVRGVILMGSVAEEPGLIDAMDAANIAVVATGSTYARMRVAWVGIDDEEAAGCMVNHLLSLGHRRIGFVTGTPGQASTDFRLCGYRAALLKAGMAVDEAMIVPGNYDYRSGIGAADALLSAPDRPTAIFASSDQMAAAVVDVAVRRGLDVPADLSVCGFDDSTLADAIFPKLTTIGNPVEEIARHAVRLLADRTKNRPATSAASPCVRLAPTLIRRHSDAPPRRIWLSPAAADASGKRTTLNR